MRGQPAAEMAAAQGLGGNELTTVNNDIMVLANPEIANLPGWVVAIVAAGGLAAALSTAAGLLLAIPALLVEGPPAVIPGRGWLGYAWLGLVGALVSYSLWFTGIRRLPVTSTALLGPVSYTHLRAHET